MKKIIVAGAGTLGLDIAQAFAKSGFDVWVKDISAEIIKNAEARLFNPAVLMRLVEIIRGRDTSDEAFKAVCDLQVMSIKVLSLYFILCQRLFSAPTPGRETCAS